MHYHHQPSLQIYIYCKYYLLIYPNLPQKVGNILILKIRLLGKSWCFCNSGGRVYLTAQGVWSVGKEFIRSNYKKFPGVNILQPRTFSWPSCCSHSLTHHPDRSNSSQPPGHNCQALLPLDHLQLPQHHQGVPLHELEGSLQSLMRSIQSWTLKMHG